MPSESPSAGDRTGQAGQPRARWGQSSRRESTEQWTTMGEVGRREGWELRANSGAGAGGAGAPALSVAALEPSHPART